MDPHTTLQTLSEGQWDVDFDIIIFQKVNIVG